METQQRIHIALIPDGNRRWAEKHKKPVWYGHLIGAQRMEQFARWCLSDPEIKTVSIYALSTENLKRSDVELDKLWDIYKRELGKLKTDKDIIEKKVKVNVLGDTTTWRPDVRTTAKELMGATRQYGGRVLNVLVSYGSKFEILNAMKKAVKFGVKKIPFAESMFHKFLMVTQPVDLIIRTGGQHRISNFLLYQAAYAELYFTDKLWPDFTKKDFEKALKWYKAQQRKFGK